MGKSALVKKAGFRYKMQWKNCRIFVNKVALTEM
jgi:hypothetical protein